MDNYSARLLEGANLVVGDWVHRLIRQQLEVNKISDSRVGDLCIPVINAVGDHVSAALVELLNTDVLEQRVNPLTIFRNSTQPITDLLVVLECRPVERDEFNRRSFPNDFFGLSPATWADIDERMVEPGLEWGAWKAASVMMRKKNR